MDALARRAADAVDADYVTVLARELVRARSVVEPDRGHFEAPAAAVVVRALEELGLSPVVREVAPGRPNVVCDWHGSAFRKGEHRTLMLEGHTDVVTEGDPAAWRHPPFEGVVEEGVLHGRGSADMKGGVAAAIGALAALMRAAPDLPGRVRLGIVVDEEGMMRGIKRFIEEGWADEVDGALVCEPEENEICLFQKGAMRLTVRFRGRMAHGAMPYAGVNPIAALGRYLERVRTLEAAEQDRLGPHRYLGLPWITPTVVRAPAEGEAQHNVLPATALLALDVRTVPGQDHDALEAALVEAGRELERGSEGLRVEVELFESRPWTETPPDDPLVRAVERAYPAVLGSRPRYGGVPGATDGTFLRATAGVPIVTIGPGDREIPHQVDEFVRLEEVHASARLYAAAAVLFLADGAVSATGAVANEDAPER